MIKLKRLYEISYHGRKSIQVNIIVDNNDNILTNHSDVCPTWQCHFLNVLNVPSNFQEEVVNSVTLLLVRNHLDVVPSYVEIQSQVNYFKYCKAAGESSILLKL